MAELPVEMMYEILSRMPVKSLDCFRCVSKHWYKYIDDPSLAIVQMNRATTVEEAPILIMSKGPLRPPRPNQRQILTLFRVIKSKEGSSINPKAKKKSVLEFECNDDIHRVRGMCNGLLYLSKGHNFGEVTLSVIHPLKNEQRYELPPVLFMESCGLGFDASTNTFKMCVSVVKEEEKFNIIHTMVLVLGTEDSWREIPQVPYYKMIGFGLFAHGSLHWLGYHKKNPTASCKGHLMQFPPTHRLKVVRFDITKEEFELIDLPRIKIGDDDDWVEKKLVDLHGEVGLVYRSRSYSEELWVLKQNNEWVIHCRIDAKPPLPCDDHRIEIVGFWNKSGDNILVSADCGKRLFVYTTKSRGFHQVNLVGWEDGCEAFIHMYRTSLFSVPGIKKKSAILSSDPTHLNVCTFKKRSRRRTSIRRKTRIPSKQIYRFLNFC